MLLMVLDPRGDVVGDQKLHVGSLEFGILDSKILSGESIHEGVVVRDKSVDEDLLKGVRAKESKLASEVALDGVGLGDLDGGLAVGRGLGEEGHDAKGGEGLLGGPVLGVDGGELVTRDGE